MVIDELVRFAQGAYGEDSGHTWMDGNLRDRFLSLPRAQELALLDRRPSSDMSLAEARQAFGAPGVSDEELILRAIMQGTSEIDRMRAAGPPRTYSSAQVPLVQLVERLRESSSIRYVRVQRGSDSVLVRK
ncbi:hypothetical protein BJF78_07720 [Pseudonocardia sp. CNS-139]|nr:hypothetical protein BJF78_07720 [Pseudonocardia sp. CNS-139]